MADYLVGPDGIRVEAVRLQGAHLIFARMVDPQAQPGDQWFRVTKNGAAIGIPGYCRDIEDVADLVDLSQLHAPEDAGEETA